MGSHEHLPHRIRDIVHVGDGSGTGNGLHERFGIKSLPSGRSLEVGVDLRELVVVHDRPHKTQCKERLDA